MSYFYDITSYSINITIFIKMPFHIILTSKVVNQDIKIDLNLRYMFYYKYKYPIYLRKVESKKELKKSKRKLIKLKSRKILARDVFCDL